MARNIVANLADKREEIGDELHMKVCQLGRDVEEFLTDERVVELSKPVDDYFRSRRDALGVPLPPGIEDEDEDEDDALTGAMPDAAGSLGLAAPKSARLVKREKEAARKVRDRESRACGVMSPGGYTRSS